LLLEQHGINSKDFWTTKQRELVENGWDPIPAYLKLILDNVGPDKPLGRMTNEHLRAFGAGLKFYPGIPGLFKDLRDIAADHPVSNPAVEFYVVSSGLEEIIRGSKIAKFLSGYWACRLAEEDGQIKHVQRVVSFTEKTKYLYQINKGVTPEQGPYAVNEFVAAHDRRVPFGNMIYVGDGFTDVPCFSLLEHFNGKAFGVFDARKKDSPKKAWEKLVAPKRISSLNAPKYRKNDDLGAILRTVVHGLCFDMDTRAHSTAGR
jgi:hypothetical protein